MRHPTVVPTILVSSERALRARVRALGDVAPLLHLDVMDGAFVPNRTRIAPRALARLRTRARFNVHLMVENPERAVAAWSQAARVETIFAHAEATRDLPRLLALMHHTGTRVGLAVNPATPLRTVLPALAHVDAVLLMANAPGFAGRPLLPSTYARVRRIRARFPELTIGVDIGVTAHTAPLLRRAGATYVAAGSAIFQAPDPARAYRALVRAART